MTRRTDIVLKDFSSRVVGQLDVSTGPDNDPNLRVDPDYANLHLGGGSSEEGHSSGAVRIYNGDQTMVGKLAADGDSGFGSFATREGEGRITLDVDDGAGEISVGDGDQEMVVTGHGIVVGEGAADRTRITTAEITVSEGEGPASQLSAHRLVVSAEDDVVAEAGDRTRVGLEDLGDSDAPSEYRVDILGGAGTIFAGGGGENGRLGLLARDGRRWASLLKNAGEARLRLQGDSGARVELHGDPGESAGDAPRIRLDGRDATPDGYRSHLELGTEDGGIGRLTMRQGGDAFCSIEEDGSMALSGTRAGVVASTPDGEELAGIGNEGDGGFVGVGKKNAGSTFALVGASASMLLGGNGEDAVFILSSGGGTRQGMVMNSKGLTLVDSQGDPALRVDQNGVVHTKSEVQTDL